MTVPPKSRARGANGTVCNDWDLETRLGLPDYVPGRERGSWNGNITVLNDATSRIGHVCCGPCAARHRRFSSRFRAPPWFDNHITNASWFTAIAHSSHSSSDDQACTTARQHHPLIPGTRGLFVVGSLDRRRIAGKSPDSSLTALQASSPLHTQRTMYSKPVHSRLTSVQPFPLAQVRGCARVCDLCSKGGSTVSKVTDRRSSRVVRCCCRCYWWCC